MAVEINPMDLPIWIQVVKTPAGDAPQDLRESWIGVRMPATDEYLETEAFSLTSGAAEPARKGYAVPVKLAIACLIMEGHVLAAKRWHDNMSLEFISAGAFNFGADEVRVVDAPSDGVLVQIDPTVFPRLLPGFPFNN